MMDDLYPKQKSCILASIGFPIYVPVHSFVNSLFSLLVALDLMRKENLLFADMNNPAYVSPRNLDAALDDINMGNAYYDYYDKLIDPTNNLIIPLMLFADGMQIDKNGCICQEPWMITLGIFKHAIRNQPCAWRNIGLTKLNAHNLYSNEEIKQSKKAIWQGKIKPQQSDDIYVPNNLMDWHSQVSIIFKMILQVQQFLSGIKWTFMIDDKELSK